MSLTLTLTGTGGAQGVPAWGCECAACARARRSPQYRRQPCSGVVKFNDAITLIDAGRHDLTDRWSPGSFQQFLLTHYHMDHVQGLFPLRWGVGDVIPVYGPPDEQGCDDLFKHPGLLDFSHTVEPFVVFDLQGLQVTPLPLNHSKLTFGYLLETAHSRVAWLSDTAGLPEKTLKFLLNNHPQVMVIDCSHPPRADAPRNHYDLNTVLALNQVIRSPQVILTHISHQFDAWLMENALPSGFEVGFDGMEIGVRDERECARWPPHPNPLPRGARGPIVLDIEYCARFLPLPIGVRGDACSIPNLIAHTHLPFSALHPPVADAPDQAGAGDRPAACGDLQTGGGGRHIVCADRRSLHAASRRRANLHSLAHGQGYKRH